MIGGRDNLISRQPGRGPRRPTACCSCRRPTSASGRPAGTASPTTRAAERSRRPRDRGAHDRRRLLRRQPRPIERAGGVQLRFPCEGFARSAAGGSMAPWITVGGTLLTDVGAAGLPRPAGAPAQDRRCRATPPRRRGHRRSPSRTSRPITVSAPWTTSRRRRRPLEGAHRARRPDRHLLVEPRCSGSTATCCRSSCT